MDYWLQRRSYAKGVHTNVRQLLVLQSKLKIMYDSTLTLSQITDQIIDAASHRCCTIKAAKSLSLEYRTQLAMAKEEAGEMKAATYLRQINSIEDTRRLFQQIRHIEGKVFAGSTSRI